MPGRELRAYGDGVAQYEALVDRIRAKFERGKRVSGIDSTKFGAEGPSGSKPKRDLRTSA